MNCFAKSETRIESLETKSIAKIESEIDSNINGNNCSSVETHSEQLIELQCMESGDNCNYSVIDVVNSQHICRPYQPSLESRQLHNEKERLRRSRMKCSCDVLRQLVPGVSDKTDKATVLEHTVNFLLHLSNCTKVKCDDYLPSIPPPMSAKLLELYPKLSSDDYHYYQTIPSEDQELKELEQQLDEYEKQQELSVNNSQIIGYTESNGTQFVTTSDGMQYMIIDSTQQIIGDNHHIDESVVNSMDTNVHDSQLMSFEATQEIPYNSCVDNKFSEQELMSLDERNNDCANDGIKCAEEVIEMSTDDKENIDPKSKKIKRKRLAKISSIRRKCVEEDVALNEYKNEDNNDNNDVVMDSISSKIKKRKQKKAFKSKFNK